jgi:diguanylate cyclase (GGDEF)-like protein
MAAFFAEQADFILFFYGLAFILLGVTCFAISKHALRCRSWPWLGMFGIFHGVGEWLDLTALIVGDNSAFALLRTALMAGSYVLLLEFARRELRHQDYKVPGAWIYLPLLALVVTAGITHGLAEANATARYTLGVFGSLGTSAVFVVLARSFDPAARRLAIQVACGFGLYAIAAGIIVPSAPIWPADVLNQEWFLATTGVPIQLIRGLLASGIAVAIWGIWGEKLIAEVSSARYTRFLHKQFAATVAVMAAILLLGWALTEYFGVVHKQHLHQETRGNLDLLASTLAGETAPIDAVAKSIAGSPTVLSLLSGGQTAGPRAVGYVLGLGVDASGARCGYVFDANGQVVAFSGERRPGRVQLYSASQYYKRALAGWPVQELMLDRSTGETLYVTAYPVKSGGEITGVVLLERSLKGFDANLTAFRNPVFLVDPSGVVAFSNRPDLKFRHIWPKTVSGAPIHDAILDEVPEEGVWASVGGEAVFVSRRSVSGSDWSLAAFVPVEGIFASRVLGIAITLLATIMVLIYIVARERAVHDTVQLDRRLELEELARLLDHKATTDPLTGLSNRAKFDEALGREIVRSRRFDTPLSLVFYDIDHFKQVNDNYGHPVGDDVLIKLSALFAQRMRATDLLARWGGEEFVILSPHSDAAAGMRFAQLLKDCVENADFGRAGKLTCSFGVAELAAGETGDDLVGRADGALYRAKVNGRNRVELAEMPKASGAGIGSAA